MRQRAVTALLACVARHGLAKTTLDDVAREAGCARATLYRHVGTKADLVGLAVVNEAERVMASVRRAAAPAPDLETALVATITTFARELAEQAALGFLLAHEPEAVLPHVTFEEGDRFLALTADALAPCFEPHASPARAQRAAEWTARIVLAYGAPSGAHLDVTDPDAVRALVHAFVVPGLRGPLDPSIDPPVNPPTNPTRG